VRHYTEFPLNWSSLGRLDELTGADKGYFLVNAGGKHFPPQREIAAGQLAAAINVSLFRRLRDTYRYEVLTSSQNPLRGGEELSDTTFSGVRQMETGALPVTPRKSLPDKGDMALYPARMPITRFEHGNADVVPETAAMKHEANCSTATPASTRVSFWLCPHCLKSRLTSERPGACQRCQHEDWELIPETIWRDVERCKDWWSKLWRAHRRRKNRSAPAEAYPTAPSFHEPLPDKRAEALAQGVHAALPTFSLANARQTVANTHADLVREALKVTLQRNNIVNCAGFFVTYIRSEQKFGRWKRGKIAPG
jgi:hypothetical protein